MLPTWAYCAAFAAFLIPANTRLPAALCLLVQLVGLNAESLPNDTQGTYRYYYILSAIASAVACRIILSAPVQSQLTHATLFLAAVFVDGFGWSLYVTFSNPQPYNVTGFYVILTQMLLLWRDGNGRIRDICNGCFLSVRSRLFV